MKPAFVLDASVALTWCFDGERSAKLRPVLRSFADAEAVVPTVWAAEVANGLLVAARRKAVTPHMVVVFLEWLAVLPCRTDMLSTDRLFEVVVPLAERTGLTVYDALYLELAQRRGLPLATVDRALRVACRELMVDVLPKSL